MSNCRRCHRSIINPKSVQHGFGPVCWNKLNAQGYDERPMMFRITITDQNEASKSLERVREVMSNALKNGTRTACMNCGEPLRPENIEYYDHPGGSDLPGFGQPQWLYHHCEGKKKDGKKCNHDLSLWKLRIPELMSENRYGARAIFGEAVDNNVSCLEHLDSTDAGGEPGDANNPNDPDSAVAIALRTGQDEEKEDVCQTTMKCGTCGFDFGICSEDTYADPTCPRCAAAEAEEHAEDFPKAMPEFCREMRFGN